MKIRTTVLTTVLLASMCLTACGGNNSAGSAAPESSAAAVAETAGASAETQTGIANPWRDVTYDEANKAIAKLFKAPDGADNLRWSIMGDTGSTAVPGPMVQLTFDLEGDSFTAREQVTGDDPADISGLYYEWTVTDEGTLAGWGDGSMQAKFYRYLGDNKYVDLCTWYDVEYGASYSLSVEAPDLDGFDIQGVVEAMYDPSTQPGATVPDDNEGSASATGQPSVPVMPDDHTPVDISGCDTFTQIVDKLPKDYAYANAKIMDKDVLMVTEYSYPYDTGIVAAIDADIYVYDKDGVPVYCGYVTAGGTAYPLMVTTEGYLLVGGNHFISHYVLSDDNKVIIDEEEYVEYQSDGSGKYFRYSDVRPDENGEVEDDSKMGELYTEMEDSEIVNFQVVM